MGNVSSSKELRDIAALQRLFAQSVNESLHANGFLPENIKQQAASIRSGPNGAGFVTQDVMIFMNTLMEQAFHNIDQDNNKRYTVKEMKEAAHRVLNATELTFLEKVGQAGGKYNPAVVSSIVEDLAEYRDNVDIFFAPISETAEVNLQALTCRIENAANYMDRVEHPFLVQDGYIAPNLEKLGQNIVTQFSLNHAGEADPEKVFAFLLEKIHGDCGPILYGGEDNIGAGLVPVSTNSSSRTP